MNITADTNVLILALTGDNALESKSAKLMLASANLVTVPLVTLCEVVWVLARGYFISSTQIAQAIRCLIGSANVAVNRLAAEAGLAMLDAGGDFTDGVIAYEGRWLAARLSCHSTTRDTELVHTQEKIARTLH